MRRLLVLALSAFLAVVAGAPAGAAAPRAIAVHGPLLPAPVYLTDWEENLRLLLSVPRDVHLPWSRVDRRPYLRLTLYWGEGWQDEVREGRPDAAGQQGRFYPAVGDRPAAVIIFGREGDPVLRPVAPEGLAILAAHGVPVRLEPDVAARFAPAAVLGAAAGCGGRAGRGE